MIETIVNNASEIELLLKKCGAKGTGMIKLINSLGLRKNNSFKEIMEIARIRNEVVHSGYQPTEKEMDFFITEAKKIIKALNSMLLIDDEENELKIREEKIVNKIEENGRQSDIYTQELRRVRSKRKLYRSEIYNNDLFEELFMATRPLKEALAKDIDTLNKTEFENGINPKYAILSQKRLEIFIGGGDEYKKSERSALLIIEKYPDVLRDILLYVKTVQPIYKYITILKREKDYYLLGLE